jgi:hypothetical protein
MRGATGEGGDLEDKMEGRVIDASITTTVPGSNMEDSGGSTFVTV